MKKSLIQIPIKILIILGLILFIGYFISTESSEEVVNVNYKDKNMTIEFKSGLLNVGEATLKSHETYNEVRKVPIGNDRVLIWYEFKNFNNSYANAIGSVRFIDMREFISNKTYLQSLKGDINKIDSKKAIIPNLNYSKEIVKGYKIVYKVDNDWLPYDYSKDIPKGDITIGIQADINSGEILDIIPTFFGNELNRHAVVIGVSSGFVTSRPVADPIGDDFSDLKGEVTAINDTSPATAVRVTEIGVWGDASGGGWDVRDLHIGIYTANSTGQPDALLAGNITFSTDGDDDEWKFAGVNITILPNTKYWITIGAPNATNKSNSIYMNPGSNKQYRYTSDVLLQNFITSTTNTLSWPFYAVWIANDGIPPLLNITNPINNTNYSFNTMDINYSAKDDLSNCWYSNDTMSVNTTITCGENVTSIIWAEGQHNVSVWVNDSFNNVNHSFISFRVDTKNPNLTITNPTGSITTLNFAVKIDANDETDLMDCYFNITRNTGVSEVSDTRMNNCSDYSTSVSAYANYIVWAWINDTSGNQNLSNSSFSVTAPGAGSGGGGGTPEPAIILQKTFCGDLICQSPNDYGQYENFYNCQSDCQGEFNFDEFIKSLYTYCVDKDLNGSLDTNTPCFWTQGLFSASSLEGNATIIQVCGDKVCTGFENSFNCKQDCGKINLDTMAKNCFDDDKTTPCFWDTNLAAFVLFGGMILTFVIFTIKIPSGKETKKTRKYLRYKSKKKRWRRR